MVSTEENPQRNIILKKSLWGASQKTSALQELTEGSFLSVFAQRILLWGKFFSKLFAENGCSANGSGVFH